MSCTNCFNGCTDTTSDKCVKYTGIDVPALGIQNGDTLLHVEEVLISFLTPMITGNGITPVIDPSIICNLVSQYLPNCATCTGFTLKEILVALIKSSCDLQEQIEDVVESIADIESPYTTDCLSGVNSSSNTHSVLQAVITKLCELDTDLSALALDLSTNYVQISEIDALIQNYIDENSEFTLIKNRMVPYAVQPYYGPLSYFDGTGAGVGDWIDVYLCNGSNGTPDLRGRTLVGVTSGMFGGALPAAVDPAIPGNPAYTLSGGIPPFAGSTTGANQVTLGPTQIPSHTHTATVTDAGHTHTLNIESEYSTKNEPGNVDINYLMGDSYNTELHNANSILNDQDYINSSESNISVEIGSTGGGLAHDNVQPSRACYFIIYIP